MTPEQAAWFADAFGKLVCNVERAVLGKTHTETSADHLRSIRRVSRRAILALVLSASAAGCSSGGDRSSSTIDTVPVAAATAVSPLTSPPATTLIVAATTTSAAFLPLGQPTISSSVTGSAITWAWDANQGNNGRAWTAEVTGECEWAAAPGDDQAGTCTIDPGYASGIKTVTITVSAADVASVAASSSNATGPAPSLSTAPLLRVIQTAKSATLAAPGTCGGGAISCHEVGVSGQNFTPGATLEVNCEGDPRWFPLGSADGSGNFDALTSVCYHDTGSAFNQTITVRDASGEASTLSAW